MGIEPTYQAWKASVLPLNYARNKTALYYTKKKLPKEEFPGFQVIFAGVWVLHRCFLLSVIVANIRPPVHCFNKQKRGRAHNAPTYK